MLGKLIPWMAGAGRAIANALVKGLIAVFKTGAGFVADIGRALANYVIGLLNRAIPDKLPIPGKDINLPNNPIPQLAEGGIVTRPTLALIGEAGPEAVIPLKDAKRRAPMQSRGLGGNSIVMNFRGDPDPWSASRQAAFALRSAGLVGS
jgi:SLT domain-containing protein